MPWPECFQHICSWPVPQPSHEPLHVHVRFMSAKPLASAARPVNVLYVEAAGYVPEIARLSRGF